MRRGAVLWVLLLGVTLLGGIGTGGRFVCVLVEFTASTFFLLCLREAGFTVRSGSAAVSILWRRIE